MRIIRLFAALLALVAVAPLARADADKEARKGIQARYDQFDRAYMKKDFKSVGEVFAPDCVLKLSSENRTMQISRVFQGMQVVSKSLTVSHAKTQIASLKALEGGYEVDAIMTGDTVYAPPIVSKEDPPRRAKTRQLVHDTWKKTKKGWQIVRRIIEK